MVKKTGIFIALLLAAAISGTDCIHAEAIQNGWVQSYKAGYTDRNGNYCGGSEIMHIVPHKGKLYAFNGFWEDRNFGNYSAQVLRLDEPEAQWVADLTTSKTALKYDRGNIMHMKGNILKSVTFTTDKNGSKININLLIAASWAFNSNDKNDQATSIFVRDDSTGKWSHTVFQEGPGEITKPDGKKVKVRRVPRDIETYYDPVTKIDKIFMLGGDTGIFSGVYNSETKSIEWDSKPEYPKDGDVFESRPLGIAEANGILYFSMGGKLFKRINGINPTWTEAFQMPGRINTEMGGIRGLTTIKNPVGPGESLIFAWTPLGRCQGDIKRLDGIELKETTETSLRTLFDNEFKNEGITSSGSLGGYNMFLPIADPRSGKTVHIVGFQQTINTANETLKWNNYYKGALYSVRSEDHKYTTHFINGKWTEGKPILIAPRAYAQSPFPGEKGTVYFGGHDANFQPSTEMAWIFKAELDTVLSDTIDEVYKTNPKPPTDGLVGSNYTPAYAVNQVQFWHDFRPEVVEKELAAARKYFGISTLRVFLHDINFFQEKEVFMVNIEKFIVICDKHGIRPGFVFFDGCHRHEGIFLDKPTEPVPGYHNGRWAQSPQACDIDKDNLEKFKPYIQEIISTYRADRRILFWEIHNEPPEGDEYRDRLKKAGYKWAKEVKPTQPVLNCEKSKKGWADCEVTDIVDSHVYSNAHGPLRDLSDINPNKGTVFTEAGARWKASRRNFGGPIDFIYWLEKRRSEGKSTPGVYLCWELMVGNSNCRWHWIDKPGSPEPEIPWCGLLWPDATPVSLAEAEAIRRYVTGKSKALFFEDFETHSDKAWTVYGQKNMPVKNAATLENGIKALAGDKSWTDYILEGRVVIKSDDKKEDPGNAGLLFRVNNQGESLDEMQGYAVTFNSRSLILSKFERNKQKELAAFDLTKLKTKTMNNEWSMIRIATTGPRIRVWFNRMHPSSDPDHGLRIDFTDEDNPVMSGAIGIRANIVTAQFDDIVVLPIDELP